MANDDTAPSWLQPVLKPLRTAFLEVLTISFFANVLATTVPIFTLQVYDRVVFHNGLSTLEGLVIGMALILVFDFILRQTRSRVLQRVALSIDAKVGRRLFDKIMALPLRTLESRPAAYWQGVYRDLDIVRNTLSGATVVLLVDLPFVLLFVILVFVIAAPVAWVLVVAFTAFMILAAWSAARMTRAGKVEKEQAARRDLLVAETINGRATVKALALHRHLRPRWEALQADTIARSIDRGLRNDGYVNLAHVMTMLTTVAMTTVGALAIMEQQMTIGALIAANMLSGRMMGPMNQVVGAWRSYGGFRQSVQRLGRLFAENEERMTPAITHERPKGRLTLDAVTFRYDEGAAPVIAEARADIPPGGITCLMGRNGSGKTTLAKLLTGLYSPADGRVLIDGADMAQFSREDLAAWIGYVPQETMLFTGSIRDAIAQGAAGDEVSDEAIILAARRACVHDIIMDMPDGYETDVGEAGGLLSGGVRQRIAIARALVTDPPVIVMDEPSSNLDTEAEQKLAQSLRDLSAERNVILVTHSTALLRAARSIIVLERGRIAASGPGSASHGLAEGAGDAATGASDGSRESRRRRAMTTSNSAIKAPGVEESPLDTLMRTHRAPGWRILAALVVALIATGVAWSAVAELDEVAVAAGEVVPRSKVKIIQHLEGGIITDIYVREGDIVKSGAPLLQLDLAQTAMNKEELEVRLDGLLLARARLTAEATGGELVLPEDVVARRPAMAASERDTFEARQAELESKVAVLADQVRQRELEVREVNARRATLQKSENLARQKLAMSAELLRDNLTPKLEHLKLRSELEDIQGELAVLEQTLPRAQAALSEARQRVEEATLSFRREAREQMTETELAIARTQEVLSDAADQELRTEVRSPIDGVVKNMRYSTLGGVVKGGEPIMDIVPTGDALVIEARLDPVDRGYVRVGQAATVKVSTYDYARYGGLEGTVIQVAPDSTQPENAPPYFRVLVETKKDYLGELPGEFAITPGMMATVDIHTGTRSVLDYLIRPVLKLKHEAFRER